jgi:hypothetical protein
MLQHPDAKVIILDAEILTATVIEGLAEVVHEVGMQLTSGVQPDLGDQAREIHEATDGFIRAEETRNEGHGGEDR